METKDTEKQEHRPSEERLGAEASEKKEEQTYHCNDCGNIIYKHEVFCSKCGKLLDRYDFE